MGKCTSAENEGADRLADLSFTMMGLLSGLFRVTNFLSDNFWLYLKKKMKHENASKASTILNQREEEKQTLLHFLKSL